MTNLEQKIAPSNMKAAQNELMGVFSAFQEANDARLVEIEKKVVADVLLEEKVDRLDKALSHAPVSYTHLDVYKRQE